MRYADDDIARILSEIDDDDRRLVDPPAGLWAAIAADAGVAVDDDISGSGRAVATAPTTGHGSRDETDDSDDAGGGDATVVNLDSRRGRPLVWLTAAAAAVAVLVGALVAIGDSSTTTVSEIALSSDGLDGAPASLEGRAELVESDDGLMISVDVPDGIDTDGGYLELWLIDTDVQGMVSLGPLNESGLYAIPAGVDPGLFPVVDISVEPTDGLPTHSGRSVLRGVLET